MKKCSGDMGAFVEGAKANADDRGPFRAIRRSKFLRKTLRQDGLEAGPRFRSLNAARGVRTSKGARAKGRTEHERNGPEQDVECDSER